MDLRRTLDELAELRPNWNSYGAEAPSRWAIEAAWRYASALVDAGFSSPDVFPTPDGGIQLEWHDHEASLEWEIDDHGHSGAFLFVDEQGNERSGEWPADAKALVASLRRVQMLY